jgi:N-acetyltransferase
MTPDLQPTLVGKHLTMRPLCEDDWDALFAAASDPLIWELHPYNDRWQEPRFSSYFGEGIKSGGALVAIDNESGAILGNSRYANYAPERNEIEIGWTFLIRSVWGGAYNREMKALMLTHAFGYFDSVRFNIGASNLRSRAAIEKIGARLDGEYDVNFEGRIIPHVIYRITKAQAIAADMVSGDA